MKYVTGFSTIYRISDKNWFSFLKEAAKHPEGDADIEDCGGQAIGVVTTDISDITQELAQDLLEDLKRSMLPR